MFLNYKAVRGKKVDFTDTAFHSLMRKRIYHVLLIASQYDTFVLEGDGRIDEQIFNEYTALNLRYPPQFIQTPSEKEAFEILEKQQIDLVITMYSAGEKDTFDMAEKVKRRYPDKPMVVLTPFSREVIMRVNQKDLKLIDYVFSWLGNSDLLLAIIKLIEDKMNLEYDVNKTGVQTILLVEDSIRFYSSYLPNIYKIIFKQSQAFMTEGLNEHQRMLRMRGRPKIILATNWEDAISYYEKYKHHMLGIITDVRYKRNGEIDPEAGVKLVERVRKDDTFMPVLMQSSEIKNRLLAQQLEAGFLDKNSKTLSLELRKFMNKHLAFGDFLFTDPHTLSPIDRAANLRTLQQKIFQVPDEVLEYHVHRNDFSKWLNARALFPIAALYKDLIPGDFSGLDEMRQFMFDAIAAYRYTKAKGVIAQFSADHFDEYLTFSRIGDGSIGGKARGLAFLDNLIKRNTAFNAFEGVQVRIPHTVVLCTDIFDQFMEENDLYPIALSDQSDEAILAKFIKARLPFRIYEDLYSFISVVKKPVAVRSSSLLEDSHYQPFAGIYSTYMVPWMDDDKQMTEMIGNAIKSVYASSFYKSSKAYMMATSNIIDEEKMAVVLQAVCGEAHGNRFYPTLSGVARSINFYPIEPERPEDGIANIAYGLGKHIVDGGQTLRFSPQYPKKVLQTSTPELALRETQNTFAALDLDPQQFITSTDDGINIVDYPINDASEDKLMRYVVSTYDYHSRMLRVGKHDNGKPLVTFSSILSHGKFPLAEIIKTSLTIGQQEINKPIEIEFAVDLNPNKEGNIIFNLLQIRPIVSNKETLEEDISRISPEQAIITCKSALGNGIINTIHDIVYIKPESFDPAKNRETVAHVSRINETFLQSGKNYILIGPGRWGSSDPWLGIPVKWPEISAARVIVESGLKEYRIDPSQGTHFFQNLTSFRVGYFTINPFIEDGSYDLAYLNKQPAVYEDKFLRHVRFDDPVVIKIDGKQNLGVILK
ncbi:MAG: phosphoenolpyruvate synthase [Bacteroidetes bacterium]|nr:MAG: phosphoenolpyruvate synthase [Bacteroidota bacterium]PIE88014.1 MAG: phosphoenolpyruvate synthase [Bacteroidota bacterium]